MLNAKELEFLMKTLKYTESQDDMTINLINKIKSFLDEFKNLCLWRFHWDCGRQGDVYGLFKATKEEVENAIGKDVYFGEILGKHSEVCGTIEEGEIELVSDDPSVVMDSTESGYNPLNYINYVCPICGYSYNAGEYVVEKDMCCLCSMK